LLDVGCCFINFRRAYYWITTIFQRVFGAVAAARCTLTMLNEDVKRGKYISLKVTFDIGGVPIARMVMVRIADEFY